MVHNLGCIATGKRAITPHAPRSPLRASAVSLCGDGCAMCAHPPARGAQPARPDAAVLVERDRTGHTVRRRRRCGANAARRCRAAVGGLQRSRQPPVDPRKRCDLVVARDPPPPPVWGVAATDHAHQRPSGRRSVCYTGVTFSFHRPRLRGVVRCVAACNGDRRQRLHHRRGLDRTGAPCATLLPRCAPVAARFGGSSLPGRRPHQLSPRCVDRMGSSDRTPPSGADGGDRHGRNHGTGSLWAHRPTERRVCDGRCPARCRAARRSVKPSPSVGRAPGTPSPSCSRPAAARAASGTKRRPPSVAG